MTEIVMMGREEPKTEVDVKTLVKDESITPVRVLKESADTGYEYTPSDFQDLVNYLRDKYMLIGITLTTAEGLPIASNSPFAEEDAAAAPEILKMVNRMVDSDRVMISGRDEKIIVLSVDPEIVAHIRTKRELAAVELERLREEIIRFVEGYL